jgi:hypothetical protein
MDIRLDAFHGVVFGGRNLLQGGGVYHVVDPSHRLNEAIAVANVADEVAHAIVSRVRKLVRHLRLLQLVSGVDDELLGAVSLEQRAHVLLAERSGTARDECGLVVKHWSGLHKSR